MPPPPRPARSSINRSRRPAAAELLAAHQLDEKRRGLSPGYITENGYAIRVFAKWLAPRSVLEAEREDVETWIDSLGVGLGARRNYIGHLHQFYVFANERTGCPVPTQKIRRPRVPRNLPRPMRDEHFRRALEAAPTAEIRCWVLLGAYGGLRCMEIAGLDVDDVRDDEGALLVRKGKGQKDRGVPLHPDVMAALVALPLPPSGPIFTMPDGRRVPPYVVSQRINRYLRSVGVPSTAHALRHWFGTNLLRGTHDLRVVQEMLGHSSPTTTAMYAAFDAGLAGQAVRALSVGLAES
jgi:integrase/recombinase XerD